MIPFDTPWVLFGLLLLPLLAGWRHRQIRRDRVLYPPLQLTRTKGRHRTFVLLRLPLELLLVATLIVALAGPYREDQVELLDDPGIDVMLVLDVSLSMLAEDFEPNRLGALRQTAQSFLDRSPNHRVGLEIFAGEPFLQCPLTTDRSVLRELLDGVTVYSINQNRSAGTAVGDALLLGVDHLVKNRLPASPQGDRDQAIVLITDGESNLGIDPTVGALFAKQENVNLYVIGIGGREPVRVLFEGRPVGGADSPYLAFLDDAQLEAVATAAEGQYYRAVDGEALVRIFADLSRLASSHLETRRVFVRRLGSSWLALLLVPLFTLHVVISGLVLRRPLR